MQDHTLNAPLATRRRGSGGRTVAATFAAALLLGAAGTAWISWHYGWLTIGRDAIEGAGEGAAINHAGEHVAQAPQRTAVPSPALPPESLAKIAALEARLAQLDQEAKAAAGNANRAEGLLIAFAARRAIERGEPLGYLEHQLRLRFGESQPQSVERLIKASTQPITLDLLSEQLALIEPDLTVAAPDETAWDWVQREIGQLFIIRHQDSPSPAPEKRIERARQYLAGGRVEAAVDEINRMPGRSAARDWLAKARSYIVTERALNIIENAAIMQPQGAPEPVAAPAPPPTAAASPSPTAAPTAESAANPGVI